MEATVCPKSKIGQHVYESKRYRDGPKGAENGYHYVCVFCDKERMQINGDGILFVDQGSRTKNIEYWQRLRNETR